MSVRKILIDYSEYQRLLHVERHYEELVKQSKEGKEGKGDISLTLAKNKTQAALEMPISEEIASITVPPNSQFPTTPEQKNPKNPPTEKFIVDKWYQIGRPL